MTYTLIRDLATRARDLAQEGYPTEHVQGRAVFVDDHLKVLAFPFDAGDALDEHTAPHPAILHFLEGDAEVTLGDDTVDAGRGTWIHMPAKLPHGIRARTATLMLLIILRNVGE